MCFECSTPLGNDQVCGWHVRINLSGCVSVEIRSVEPAADPDPDDLQTAVYVYRMRRAHRAPLIVRCSLAWPVYVYMLGVEAARMRLAVAGSHLP